MKHAPLLLAALLAAAPVLAQQAQPQDHDKHHAAAPQGDPVTAEVRRVDKAGGKITLKHGEIKSLDMPPMTMVFQVRDPKVLDQVKAGDTVRFRAIQDKGAYVVTDLQPAK
jgi:Cu(I)/Ag(I) efflux system periplasmic protein CusF